MALQQTGRGGQQAAAGQKRSQAGKTRHQQAKAPLHAAPKQPLVQVQRPVRLIDHGGVLGGQVLVQVARGGALGGVVKHPVSVFKQALLHNVGAIGRARAEHELALLLAQQLQARNARGDHAQLHLGRRLLQALQQRRQQQVALQIVGGQGEAGLPLGRIEELALGKTLHVFQQGLRRCQQGFGARRGHDAAPGLDKQRVAHDRAQPIELVAHRRLRHPQALGGGRDRAGLRHRHQQAQQTRIECVPIKIAHESNDEAWLDQSQFRTHTPVRVHTPSQPICRNRPTSASQAD